MLLLKTHQMTGPLLAAPIDLRTAAQLVCVTLAALAALAQGTGMLTLTRPVVVLALHAAVMMLEPCMGAWPLAPQPGDAPRLVLPCLPQIISAMLHAVRTRAISVQRASRSQGTTSMSLRAAVALRTSISSSPTAAFMPVEVTLSIARLLVVCSGWW